ncbi:unnamed protein product [Rhodiola kirilowii]
MERHRCKLCWRRFGSGRALGGHMRSHVMNPSMYSKREFFDSDTELGEEEMEEGSMTESMIVQDRESESSETSRRVIMTGRRSKRLRPSSMQSGLECKENKRVRTSEVNRSESWTEVGEQGSDVSDSTVEEVAFCLMMLSRDTWNIIPRDEHEKEKEEPEVYSEDDSTKLLSKTKRISDETNPISNEVKLKEKYKCQTCSKTFTSYQALGGHKASHNKVRPAHNFNSPADPKTSTQSSERRIHECPICHRVFPSGQALGGHKRTHANVVLQQPERPPVRCGDIVIDLNFPAPVDEDGVEAFLKSTVVKVQNETQV